MNKLLKLRVLLTKKGSALVLGGVFYILALDLTFLHQLDQKAVMPWYLIPYVILLIPVIKTMVERIGEQRFVDENLLIIIATIGSFSIGMYIETIAVMLFFQVGRMIETSAVTSTKKSIAQYMDIRPEYANLKHGDTIKIVDPRELQPRQTIVIKPGEKIPADAVVIRGSSMIDTKALTGEFEPAEVKIGSKVFSGCINLSGVIEARVIKDYKGSTASRIMELVEKAADQKAESEYGAERFTRIYTPAVVLLGFLIIIIPPMILGQGSGSWMLRGFTFLVAACPCGLFTSVPLAFLGGIGAASRQGVLIKGSIFLERLSQTETFMFDKTGTLTKGVFNVKEICPNNIGEEELLKITAYGEAFSSHPIAVSLREAYGKRINTTKVTNIKEESGFGVCGTVDGREVCIGNSRFMNRQGYYCHAVREIGTAVHVNIDGQYAGYILMADSIRSDVKKMMRWFRRHHYEVIILTGDNERVAEDVAKRLGVDAVFANLMPEDKMDQVNAYLDSRMEDECVCFVGDGINDAPVLARADIGIAMGGLGADAALEAADIILMEDEPSKIINAIRISKETRRTVRMNFIFALGMKLLLLVLAVFGLITMQRAIIADIAVMLIHVLNSFWVYRYPE